MADLTTAEKTALKKMVAEKNLRAEIDAINVAAQASRATKIAEASAIEAKRLTDVQAKEAAIANL